MTDLKALAERCLDMSEDVREIVDEIAKVAGYKVKRHGHPCGTVWYTPTGQQVQRKHYLHSIDAALSLAKDGARAWHALSDALEQASVHSSEDDFVKHLPRFICAAILGRE